MNIQPLGSSATPKLDDRPAAGVGPQAAAAGRSAAAPEQPATQPAKAAPSRAEVDDAVKKLNDAIPGSSQQLQFSVDHDTREIVVKLIDQNTKEVVRQMPSEEALRMAKSIDKLQGRLIDHTA